MRRLPHPLLRKHRVAAVPKTAFAPDAPNDSLRSSLSRGAAPTRHPAVTARGLRPVGRFAPSLWYSGGANGAVEQSRGHPGHVFALIYLLADTVAV